VILSLFFAVGCKKDKDVSGVTIDQKEITLSVGAMATLKATVLPRDATNKAVSWTSSDVAVATVVNGIVTAEEVGTATITATTEDGGYTATCVVMVTTEWVEINGVKWAKRNVNAPGTFAANPEDAGMFYQWNRKVGWSSTDPTVNSNGGTAWDSSTPEGDSWEKVNDPCPAGWRVPTLEEQQSLLAAGSEWTTENGVNGRIFGSGENTVFFPATGGRHGSDGTLVDVGNYGYYWGGTPYPSFSERVYSIYCFEENAYTNCYHRSHGFSVRCVSESIR